MQVNARQFWEWGAPWSMLSSVGNSNVAKATILIPLIGYLIIFNEKLLQYLDLVREIGGVRADDLSVSPRFLLIYFGLCAISMGVIVYSMCCPPEIKQYSSMNAYVLGDGPSIKFVALSGIESTLMKSKFSDVLKGIRGEFERQRADREQIDQEMHNAVLRFYYRHMEYSFPKARHLVLFFLFGGVRLFVAARLGGVLACYKDSLACPDGAVERIFLRIECGRWSIREAK